MKKNVRLTPRSIVLGLIYLFNSITLYIPSVCGTVYGHGYYNYIMAASLVVAAFSVFNFRFNPKILAMALLSAMLGFVAIQTNHLPSGNFFALVWFVGLFCCFRQFEIQEWRSPVFHYVNIAFWCYLVVYAFVYRSVFYSATHGDDGFVGMLNPNTVGLGIAQYALLLGITGVYDRSEFKKIRILLYGISLVGIYFSRSRTSLLIFAAALLMKAFIKRDGFKRVKTVKAGTIAIVMGGIIFPFAYVALWKKIGWGAVFLGKSLFTGRERIWATLFDYVKRHPQTLYWGAGMPKEILYHEHFNPHNSYLAFFAEYGLTTSIIFCCFLLFLLFQKYDKLRVLCKEGRRLRALGLESNHSSHIETDISAIVFVLFSLCIAYTETYYTYVLTVIYIAYGYGAVGRKRSA